MKVILYIPKALLAMCEERNKNQNVQGNTRETSEVKALAVKVSFPRSRTQTLGLECRVEVFCSRGGVRLGEMPALMQYFSLSCAPETHGMLFTRQIPESDFEELLAK